MNLSDRTELFPERPWFKAWRENLNVLEVIEECTFWMKGKLSATKKGKDKLDALYEFLAVKGRLGELDAAWNKSEDIHEKQGY